MTYRDPKSMLFEAVFNGNIKEVKHLISSGIDKNTVLHNPMRWEGATVMGTSAYEGHIDIVKYLVEAGTPINFVDPCLGRNALHWACMGGNYQVVSYLLQNGADVNHMDKDKVTPLIHAAIGKYCDIVNLLINKGACVNHTDRLRCSALHYATVHANKTMVRLIIKAGGLSNNQAIVGKGSPLENLVYQRDRDSCLFLLESGYKAENEFWIKKIENRDASIDPFLMEIVDKIKEVPSLKCACRTAIRGQMNGRNVEGKLNSLNLPTLISDYILLKNI